MGGERRSLLLPNYQPPSSPCLLRRCRPASFRLPLHPSPMPPGNSLRLTRRRLSVRGQHGSPFNTGQGAAAGPRAKAAVIARGLGPFTEPNVNDVLSGRGGRIDAYPVNVGFRSLIAAHKARYLTAMSKMEKAHITAEVVEAVRDLDPPGRFLEQDPKGGAWWDIGDVKARKKVQKAITEKRKK